MALVAIGQTFVIIGGGIDLSAPAVLSGSAVLMSGLTYGRDASLAWVIPLLLGLRALVGLANGLGVTAFGVSPIIMTLGMQGVVQGAMLVYTQGTTTGSTPSAIVWLSTHSGRTSLSKCSCGSSSACSEGPWTNNLWATTVRDRLEPDCCLVLRSECRHD